MKPIKWLFEIHIETFFVTCVCPPPPPPNRKAMAPPVRI